MNHRDVEDFKASMGGWLGWNWFEGVIDQCTELQSYIVLGAFKTGSRINELNKIKKNMVSTTMYKDYVAIINQPLEKQKLKIERKGKDGKVLRGENGNKLYDLVHNAGATRTYIFPRKEKFTSLFLGLVKQTPNPTDLVFPYSYNKMYYEMAKIGMVLPEGEYMRNWTYYKGEFHPHLWRSVRACQLLRDYKYSTKQLCRFMGWKSSSMADLYTELTPIDLMVEENQVVV